MANLVDKSSKLLLWETVHAIHRNQTGHVRIPCMKDDALDQTGHVTSNPCRLNSVWELYIKIKLTGLVSHESYVD